MPDHPAYPSRQVLEIEWRVEQAEIDAEVSAIALQGAAETAFKKLRMLDFPHMEPIPGYDLADLIEVLKTAANMDIRKYKTQVGDIVRDRECEHV